MEPLNFAIHICFQDCIPSQTEPFRSKLVDCCRPKIAPSPRRTDFDDSSFVVVFEWFEVRKGPEIVGGNEENIQNIKINHQEVRLSNTPICFFELVFLCALVS